MNNEDLSRADPLAMHHFCKDFQIEKDRRRIHLQSSWSNRKKGSKNEYPKIWTILENSILNQPGVKSKIISKNHQRKRKPLEEECNLIKITFENDVILIGTDQSNTLHRNAGQNIVEFFERSLEQPYNRTVDSWKRKLIFFDISINLCMWRKFPFQAFKIWLGMKLDLSTYWPSPTRLNQFFQRSLRPYEIALRI